MNRTQWATFVEILVLTALFWLFGGWPVPDVNEQYYIGKAIHFWHRDWLPADIFLDTPDSHWFFYAVLGLFSFVFSQNVLVWFGRFLIWGLTAWSWQRLSFTLFPKRWFSLITAAAFLFYMETFHLAGEWIIGGVEGKGFAFPFVFLGLEAFWRGQYNRTWILLGIASAFHVLVGGWTVIACLLGWSFATLFMKYDESPLSMFARIHRWCHELKAMLPGLFIGLAISLFGLIPALMLDFNASAETVRQAHRIYVYQRLSHHLVPSMMPWVYQLRFGLLVGVWFVLCRMVPSRRENGSCRLDGFVFAAIFIAAIGMTIDYGSIVLARWGWIANRFEAADLLRFYWFRLSDWAVPMGLAFGSAALLLNSVPEWSFIKGNSESVDEKNRPNIGHYLALLIILFVLFGLFKEWFQHISEGIARSQTADPTWPVPPRPITSVSFLAAILLFGLLVRLCALFQFRQGTLHRACSGLLLIGFILAIASPFYYTLDRLNLRTSPVIPRSSPPKDTIVQGWLNMCQYIRDPKHTPENAVFLVPRGCDSFKWHAHRAEVGTWKEIPQDAASIVSWYHKMELFHTVPGSKDDATQWNQPLVMVLISKGRRRVIDECHEYGIDFIVIENPPYVIASHEEAMKRYREFFDHDLVYQNDQFTLLRVPPKESDSK